MRNNLSKDEIIDLLSDDGKSAELYKFADETRKKFVGDEIHLRGLIEFSNICKRQCKYCGLRSENKKTDRYRLSKEEILKYASNAVKMGYRTLVLQSGEDDFFTADRLCEIISEIKKLDTAVTLSIGEKTFEEYKAFKKAGADRYLLRIETTDKALYKEMHPNMSYENRAECLYNLKRLGYETGTGCLVGIPNQTIASLAEDILFFKELNADMVGIGPFIPHQDNQLSNAKGGAFELALKVMAITRILLKDINIPATTAMETINPNGRIIALQSGANVVMPNVTGTEYRAKYEIYPNKICINDSPDMCRGCIENKIKAIGRTISKDYGFRKNHN